MDHLSKSKRKKNIRINSWKRDQRISDFEPVKRNQFIDQSIEVKEAHRGGVATNFSQKGIENDDIVNSK
jgi:hypothetical protein